MAPPHKIGEYLNKEELKYKPAAKYEIPLFFEQKKSEEKIRTALKEKETLLKEIHHRVKNNLQIISSLLKLHAHRANDKGFTKLVEESQNRIISMALIHEMLYANSDLTKINLAQYSRSLFEKLQSSYNKGFVKLKLKIPTDFHYEIDKMIPIGLILNEALSNTFKYAFKDKKGNVSITMSKNALVIADDGIGFTQDEVTQHVKSNFGMQLIQLLADQIDATVSINSKKGTSIELNFSEDEPPLQKLNYKPKLK